EYSNNFRKLFPKVEIIIINGFNEFTSLEVEIINSLTEIKGIKLYLNFDFFLYNPMIFSHLTKCYDKFENKGFNRVEDISAASHSNFQNSVRSNLFLKKEKRKESRFSKDLIKITAVNREEEIDLIAKEVKHLMLDQKVEAHKICLAFNLIKDYSQLIRDKFDSYGIPFNLTDRISLDNSSPIAAIINLLEILESDFYYKNIFRAVSSGFVKIGDIDFANLLKISSSLKIVVGFDNWNNTINDAIKNLKYSDDNPEESEYKRKIYKKALYDIRSLYEMLDCLSDKLTIPEFVKRLESVVYKTNLFTILLDDDNRSAENNIKAVTTFFETATEIFSLLEQEYSNEQKFTLKFFLDQLRTFCGWARFNIKEKSDYGVLVTTIEEIRGLNFSHLFIGGLCDGDFPTRYSPEIFFSGSFAKKENIHQTEERYKFYQSLCSWRKKLYLTHPVSHSGRELVESIFLKDFMSYFDVSLKNAGDYLSTIYSYEELLEHTGTTQANLTKDSTNTPLQKIGIDIDNIRQAINVDKMRITKSSSKSIFNGYLLKGKRRELTDDDSIQNTEDNDEIIAQIESRIPKQFSISQLENYAKCPFKYFVERVLNIEILEEPVEEIEAMEMGNLLHTILFKFYTLLRERGSQFPDEADKRIKEAEDLIFNIAIEEIENASFSSPLSFYEKEKLLGLNGDKRESILHKLLENEIAKFDGYLPEYFEVGFGRIRKTNTDKNLSSENPLDVNGIKLRGKIDRIEINESESKINIVDYKLSGKKPGIDELWEGISLQLPFYLFAGKMLLEKKTGKNYNFNQMYIYSLKYASGQFGKNKVNISRKRKSEPDLTEELISKTLSAIADYVNSISAGEFGISKLEDKEEKVCKYCDFRSICRVGEIS
ncbi:PD-(D/E)XK nuclease family protein, partial [Bacteroidota bacterium]